MSELNDFRNIPEDLYELEETIDKKKNQRWMLDEMKMRLNIILNKFNKKIDNMTRGLAEERMPYFMQALNNENPKIKEYALKALEYIEQKYPDVYYSYFDGESDF